MRAYVFKAICTNVVDGDTADFVIDAGFMMTTTQRLRFVGINTPERNQEGYKEAKLFVEEMILESEVYVQTEKTDVFGRYLAKIFIPNGYDEELKQETYVCLNDLLIEKGLARVYNR